MYLTKVKVAVLLMLGVALAGPGWLLFPASAEPPAGEAKLSAQAVDQALSAIVSKSCTR